MAAFPGRPADPRRRRAPLRQLRPIVVPLEGRIARSGVAAEMPAATAPTADEQYMLQLINRARSDPKAEARRLLGLVRTDPQIRATARQINLAGFLKLMTRTPRLAPLAFNPGLIEAARDHNETIAATDQQQHAPPRYLIDASLATTDDGQPYFPVGTDSWAVGENVFAYTSNLPSSTSLRGYVDYLHAGLMLDWGNPDLGHLKNLMAPGPGQARKGGRSPYREVGIGLLTGVQPQATASTAAGHPGNRGLDVGPVVVTQEFAWRSGAPADLVGAVYVDRDGDRFYTPGEGLGGVVITATGHEGQGSFQTTTWASGGYTLPLPPGTYSLTAIGPGLDRAESRVVTIGTDNVGWDIVAEPA